MEVIRFDFNGSSGEFKRTPQGFLRVNARLTKTGVFKYDRGREYRPDTEVFRVDSLASLKGAPVTDLHPADSPVTPQNARAHIVGLTESVERDGDYLKGSLIVFHEDTIKAIESGERKEISLGYQCELDQTPGEFNGQSYDAVQKNIVINHVALGPKGWGRAGPDCAIRTDSQTKKITGENMSETIRLDGVDVAMTADSITALFAEKKRQLQELKGRLDAVGQELAQTQAAKAELEDPKTVEDKVQSRLRLVEQSRVMLGSDFSVDGKTDAELKFEVIKKFCPDVDRSSNDQAYLDGMFEAICGLKAARNDSLANTQKGIHQDQAAANSAYEKWVEQSAKMWTLPLAGKI